CAPASVSSQASRDWCFAAGQWLSPARMRLGAQSSDIAAPSSRADRDPGSLGMVASGPGLMLRSNECVYFETGLFGVVCVFCVRMFCGSVPGGRVPGGTSIELGGAVIGGVLPSWL